jgi:hypothetical protein
MNKLPALKIYNTYLTVAKVVAVDVIGLLSVALPHHSLPSATAPPLLDLLIHYVYCKIQIKNLH